MTEDKFSRKNIILIMVDCLRRDHLSCYGSKIVNTPNIDSFAEDGVTFLNAFSNGGYTTPSVSSFLTSVATPFIKRDHLKIQELLKMHGYKTIAINPNVQLMNGFCRDVGLIQGFDVYETLLLSKREKYEAMIDKKIHLISKIIYRYFFKKKLLYNFFSNLICYSPLPIGKPAPRANIINNYAISNLINIKTPFFLWLFYLDVHNPYLPKKSLRDLSLNRKFRYFKNGFNRNKVKKIHDLYIGEIKIFDQEFGSLLSKLKELNLYNNSHIILTADHGEQFLEHDKLGHEDLYDEGLAIPLIIKEAGKIIGKKVDDLVSLLDLAPTIRDLAGINSRNLFSGNSLRSTYRTHEKLEQPVVSYLDTKGITYSFRTNDWKLIFRKNQIEMYNLLDDPLEKKNIYNLYPKKVEELQIRCNNYLKYLQERSELKSEEFNIKKAISNLKF